MTAMKPISANPGSDRDPLPTYDARHLTQQGDRAQIVLDDQIYTLRITRANKLILTK